MPTTTFQHSAENDGREEVPGGTSLTQLIAVATTVLQQAIDLVENVLTADDQLTTHSKYLPGSTIGKHLRHARDHFVLLLDSISRPPPYIVSFDARIRNTPMESSLSAAREALKETVAHLEGINVVPDTPLTLNAITPQPQTLQTSFGRELWFTSLHAVHHWSMIRVIAGEMGIELDANFGFAPSTLIYKNALEKAKI